MDVAHVPVLDVSPAVLKSLQFLFFFLSPGFSRSMWANPRKKNNFPSAEAEVQNLDLNYVLIDSQKAFWVPREER